MAEFYKTRGGSRFDSATGKLYVFTSESVEVRRAWPEPMAWRKTAQRPAWEHFRPDIRVMTGPLAMPETEPVAIREVLGALRDRLRVGESCELSLFDPLRAPWADALREWNATIPEEVREVVSRFPKRQWHLLSMIARCGDAALDLARSNPPLAFALASNWVFHKPAAKKPLRSARALLARGRKQRDILGWLGFPATGSARKALRKVVPEAVDISKLLYLRDGLRDPAAARLLAHVPRINGSVIRFVTDPALLPFVSAPFLEDAAGNETDVWLPDAPRLLRDTLAMYALEHPGRTGFVPRSLAHLREVHDELVEDVDWFDVPQPTAPFPPPPLAGNDHIAPIRSWEEIVQEGCAQQNCVASYAARVVNEQSTYIYRVMHPERCTMSITRRGDRWSLEQIMLAGNRPVSRDTEDAVLRWLATMQARADADRKIQLRLDLA